MAKRERKTIYTSIPKYLNLSERIQVKDYGTLSIFPWAKKRIAEMRTSESSYAEEVFVNKCGAFRDSLIRQVFFKVNDRCYFLDFFMPGHNIAIEIDGSYHQKDDVAKRDAIRDSDFRSIGIRTIRFTTAQLFDKDFKEKYYLPAMGYVGKRANPKVAITSHQVRLKRAVDELKKCGSSEAVEIRSKSTAFLRAISHDTAPAKFAADQGVLCQFYDIKDEKHLMIMPRFIGSMRNMKKKERAWVKTLEAACLVCRADRVIEV